MRKYQIPHSSVMVKLTEDTTLTQRLNVKHSIFVLEMALEVLPSTVSSAPMEPCLTNNILFVTGGSMLTAHWLSLFMLLMMKSLLREMPILQEVAKDNMVELEAREELEADLEVEEAEEASLNMETLAPVADPLEEGDLQDLEHLLHHQEDLTLLHLTATAAQDQLQLQHTHSLKNLEAMDLAHPLLTVDMVLQEDQLALDMELQVEDLP